MSVFPAQVRVRDVSAVAAQPRRVCFMGRRITALKVQKRNRQRVNVHLDGQFAFGLAAVEAAHLRVGQVLSDEDIARLRERDTVERAAGKALNLLSYRPRSRAELRRRLLQKGYEEPAVEETLDRLSRAGLLDDLAFARYWVENRFQFNPRGLTVLRQELRQKGVDDAIIEEVLAEYDEEAAAALAAEAAVRRLHGRDPATFRRKMRDYLRRRGFRYAIIGPLVDQALTDHVAEDPLEDET